MEASEGAWVAVCALSPADAKGSEGGDSEGKKKKVLLEYGSRDLNR